MNKNKVNILLSIIKEFNNDTLEYEDFYQVKLERDLIEKITSDGMYFKCQDNKDLIKAINSFKKRYPKHIIKIDKEFCNHPILSKFKEE